MAVQKDTIVSTKSGKVEGSYEGGQYIFKGLPYAAPPVGDLRWMPPRPVKPWKGIRPAKHFGPIAPQNTMPGGFIMQAPQAQSEDCLFLNIWTPGPDDAKRPVMVWIHGGAFIMGSSSDSMYDSDKLLKRGNIVLVSINYRRRGEQILAEGDTTDVLYFVGEGVVKVFKTSADGKEQILRIIRPGDSFNDVPVLNGGVSLVSAAAMSLVTLYAIKKSDLEKVMRDHPQIALNIIKVLSQRVEELISLVEDLSFRHVNGRVAKVLLEYAGDKTGDRPRLTQQEMAAMIGTAREMVGRSLKSLEGAGAIRMERNKIIITNQRALRETAGID